MLSMIKALGLQERIRLLSIINYFFVGLPSAYMLAITFNIGINGLWYGQLICYFFNLVGYSYYVYKVNWSDISDKCHDDLERELMIINKLSESDSY